MLQEPADAPCGGLCLFLAPQLSSIALSSHLSAVNCLAWLLRCIGAAQVVLQCSLDPEAMLTIMDRNIRVDPAGQR